MKTREFTKLGVSPSMLGFGCMRFPLDKDGNIDEVESQRMLDKAITDGVTYIDTAFPYHDGASEPFVGRALKKYPRDSYYLATKLPIWQINSRAEAKKTFYDQLERLDVDYVDFYLLHALDEEKWAKVIKFDLISLCEELREEGKLKYIGFSFHDEYSVFEKIINYYPWDFCQLQINYMDTDIQQGMKGYELSEKLGIPVIVMEPIKGGSLATLPNDVASLLRASNPDASLSSWALRYTGTLPNVKVILSGMSTFDQVLENLDTFNDFKVLDNEELQLVQKVADTLKSRTKNGCTNCGYCMPCSFGVDIPSNFKYWNNCFVYADEATFKGKYEKMKDEAKASNCQECGACEAMCPQQLSIIKDLKQVNIDMAK